MKAKAVGELTEGEMSEGRPCRCQQRRETGRAAGDEPETLAETSSAWLPSCGKVPD